MTKQEARALVLVLSAKRITFGIRRQNNDIIVEYTEPRRLFITHRGPVGEIELALGAKQEQLP